MTPEEQDAQVRLEQLRGAIEKFNRERLKTEEYTRGVKPCRVPREQVAQTVQSLRDTRAEEEAARQLADLQRIMLGREPSPAEASGGVPSAPGLGLAPLVIAGVAGGAWVLSSLFSYLAEHEQRIQRELNPNAFTASDMYGSVSQWLLPALVVGGVLVGGYYLLKKPSLPVGKLPRRRLMELNAAPDEPDEHDVDEEDEADEADKEGDE